MRRHIHQALVALTFYLSLIVLILLCSGCATSNWNVSLEERELSYQVTDRLRLDFDDGLIVWECSVTWWWCDD